MVYRTKNWTICLCFPENCENVEAFFPSSRGKKKSQVSLCHAEVQYCNFLLQKDYNTVEGAAKRDEEGKREE